MGINKYAGHEMVLKGICGWDFTERIREIIDHRNKQRSIRQLDIRLDADEALRRARNSEESWGDES